MATATIDDVYNEIDRIEAAKEAIEGAIEERGVEVPGNSLLGDLPPLIRQIPGPVQADWDEDDPDAPDFIKNKPTIPEPQEQSDWNENNSESPSYIKNKPTIPSAPGTLDTNNEESQQVSGSESLGGDVKLHKISKTGSYSDLLDKPNIPSAQIQSDWNEADDTRPDFIKNKPAIPAAQIQSDWEQSNSEAKDFIKNKPTIPAAQVQSDWNESDSEKKSFIKNKPTIPAAQVQSDWEQSNSEAKDFIKNKPTIPAAQVQSDWSESDSEKKSFIKNKPTIPTVPEISTDIAADKNSNTKTASPKAVYDEVRPAIQNSQPVGGMLPNVLYNFGQLAGNTTFLLAAVSDAAIVNHYYWVFDTSSAAPTITWPSGLSWFGGSAPQIAANKHYEISVLNGVGVAMEV